MLGEKIAALRREQKLRQEDLSQLLGVSRQTISNYEKGVRDPDSEMLIKIAKFFNVSTDYLLDLTDDRSHHHRVQEDHPAFEHAWAERLLFLLKKLDREDRKFVEYLVKRLTGLK